MFTSKNYLVFLSSSGRPQTTAQRVHQEMLYFLDDHHLPVQVFYNDHLPQWIRQNAFFSHIDYFFKLLFAPPCTVIVDYELHGWLGLAVGLARWITRHKFIVSIQQTFTPPTTWFEKVVHGLTHLGCLYGAHNILIDSENTLMQIPGLNRVPGKVKLLNDMGLSSAPNWPDGTANLQWISWGQGHARWWRKHRRFDVLIEKRFSN